MCVCVCGYSLVVDIKVMNYSTFVSLNNLFVAWGEFRRGKKNKVDVQLFERNLEDNLFQLHHELKYKTYRHGSYESFYVNDPKRRHIHKASVRDRVVHHLLYIYLYQRFNQHFIYDSYSCRLEKGTHKAVDRLEIFTRRVSKNYTKNCWVLHLDIKKFFASVDHSMLKSFLTMGIDNVDILWLLEEVIDSFNASEGKGIPLGNLTSQVFANIYMDDFDQYIKHKLQIKYYIRYADDFIIVSDKKELLISYIDAISDFLESNLKLALHPKKITIRRLTWGIDFLGYIVLPHYRLPRTKTKRRIFTKLDEKIGIPSFNQSLQSYLGYLGHANTYGLKQRIKNRIWFSTK